MRTRTEDCIADTGGEGKHFQVSIRAKRARRRSGADGDERHRLRPRHRSTGRRRSGFVGPRCGSRRLSNPDARRRAPPKKDPARWVCRLLKSVAGRPGSVFSMTGSRFQRHHGRFPASQLRAGLVARSWDETNLDGRYDITRVTKRRRPITLRSAAREVRPVVKTARRDKWRCGRPAPRRPAVCRLVTELPSSKVCKAKDPTTRGSVIVCRRTALDDRIPGRPTRRCPRALRGS